MNMSRLISSRLFAFLCNACARKALVLAGGELEDAVEWLLQHQDDADIDEPLTFEQYKAIGGLKRKENLPPAIAAAIQNCICTFAVTGKTFAPQGTLRAFSTTACLRTTKIRYRRVSFVVS